MYFIISLIVIKINQITKRFNISIKTSLPSLVNNLVEGEAIECDRRIVKFPSITSQELL